MSRLDPTYEMTRQPRDADAACQRRQEYAVQHPTENAMALVYNAGLPAAAAPLVRRLLALETENLLLKADIGSLSARLAKLENKA